ncbi:MAG: hypothetical protein JKP96_06585 [Oceanicaulis sp.]|jgi:hypothetical protein|nr:hypothetical protein [Oceanicaulis sp.]
MTFNGPITTCLKMLAEKGASPGELIEACAKMEEAMPRWLVAEADAGDKPKRRQKLPDGFPDERALGVACTYWREQGFGYLGDSVETEAKSFRAHHESKGTLAADWPATWRTWYVNQVKFAKKDGRQPSQPAAPRAEARQLDERDPADLELMVKRWKETGVWTGRQIAPPDDPETRIPDAILQKFDIVREARLL